MSFRLNVTNKITVNAGFKTTITIAMRTAPIIGTLICYHQHQWALTIVGVVISMLAWVRVVTGVPFGLALFAWDGGTVEYETPDGKERVKLSGLPDSRAGIVLSIAVVAIAAVLIPGILHSGARATARTPVRVTPTASALGRAGDRKVPVPAAVIEMYYAAVNKRDWPTASRLWGNDLVRGPAYRAMIAGYRCTVHDWVTEITPNGGSTLVRVRALESDGTVTAMQSYWYSYVIRGGLIKEGVSVGHTGNPPPGCR